MLQRLALAIAITLLPAHSNQDKPGAVEGTVTLPEFVPRAKSQRYPGLRPPGEYLRGAAVVFIDSVPGTYDAPKNGVELAQKNRQFVREIDKTTFEPCLSLPVLKGTTVLFPNYDDEYHNVFSRSKVKELELGRYGRTDSEESTPKITFDKPGAVHLRCEIHANMHAAIVVLENPFFATADKNGRYSIARVPPGKYKIYAFHEEHEPDDAKKDPLRAVGQDVEITSGGTAKIDFDLRKK